MAGFRIVDLYNNKRKVSSIAAATLNRNISDNSGDKIHEKSTMTTTAVTTTSTTTTAATVGNSPLRTSSHSSAVTVAVDSRKNNSNVDRQQQNHPSDSASVASTVKISNVAGATLNASPSKGNSIPPTTTSQQTRFLPVGLISVIQSQPKQNKATSSPTTVLPVPGINEQHDLLSAPTTSSTSTETATTIQAESFLLCTLERISPNKYLCIVTDRNFISPALQKQLLNSDRSQPIMTASGLRSIWNHLSVHDYQCIANSVLHHMRIVERQRSPFHDIKKQWKLICNGCTRSTSANPAPSSSASSSAASSSVPPSSKATVTMIQEDPSNHRGRQQQDIDESSCVSESRQHLELLQTVPLGVPTLSSLSMSSSASGSNAEGSTQQHQLMSNKNNPLLQQLQQPPSTQPNQQSQLLSQEDDPMHLLNEILDSASDSSYSFGGGYTTTTSMTSNSIDSHHQYNMANRSTNPNIKNGNSNRRPPQNRMSYKRNNGSTTSSITSASSSTYNNTSNTTSSSKQQYHRNTSTSANQQQQQQDHHHHHSDPNDNDSTTSSSYLSIASGASTNSNTNDHISISGSVASV